jgi:AbrB family looped-hinge helix DNA binding protein
MLVSKLSRKGQITIPKQVRKVLGISPGDSISYVVKSSSVILRRVDPFDLAFHRALSKTLDEWASPDDEEAFRGL